MYILYQKCQKCPKTHYTSPSYVHRAQHLIINKPEIKLGENKGGREGVWTCYLGPQIKRTGGINRWSHTRGMKCKIKSSESIII